MAQLVEHDLAKVGVAGSSPVFRSEFTPTTGYGAMLALCSNLANCESSREGRAMCPALPSRPIARRQFWSCITDTERLVDALGTYNRPVRGLRSRKRGHAPTWTVASTVLVLLSITETVPGVESQLPRLVT